MVARADSKAVGRNDLGQKTALRCLTGRKPGSSHGRGTPAKKHVEVGPKGNKGGWRKSPFERGFSVRAHTPKRILCVENEVNVDFREGLRSL